MVVRRPAWGTRSLRPAHRTRGPVAIGARADSMGSRRVRVRNRLIVRVPAHRQHRHHSARAHRSVRATRGPAGSGARASVVGSAVFAQNHRIAHSPRRHLRPRTSRVVSIAGTTFGPAPRGPHAHRRAHGREPARNAPIARSPISRHQSPRSVRAAHSGGLRRPPRHLHRLFCHHRRRVRRLP